MDISPSGLHDRLGNTSKGDTCRRLDREEVPSARSTDSYDTQGVLLVQRCLIIQRDEKGYGLTVSGDNPVFVQSVKPGGAAARAGVHQGDRIIKVNGTLVTQSNHQDVVKRIKSGSYVALTLLGPPPGDHCISRPVPVVQPTSSTSQPGAHAPLTPKTSGMSGHITGPQPADPEQQQQCTNITHHTIKKMLEKEQIHLENIFQEYTKAPSEKIFAEMQSAKKRIASLERQLNSIKGPHSDWQRTSPKSPPSQRSGSADGVSQRSSSFHVSSGLPKVHPIMHQVSAPSFPREWMPPQRDISAFAVQPNRSESKLLSSSSSMENIANIVGLEDASWAKHSGPAHTRQRSSPDSLTYFMEGVGSEMDTKHFTSDHSLGQEDLKSSDGAFPVSAYKKARSSSRGSSFGQYDSCESPHASRPESPSACRGADTSQHHGEDMDDANASEEVRTPIEVVDIGQQQEQEHSPALLSSLDPSGTNPMEGRPLPPLPLEAEIYSPPSLIPGHASQQYGTPPESHPLETLPGSGTPVQHSNIISMDDDEGTSDSEHQCHLEDHGPFNSIWKLMRHPAHLSVFLRYLLTRDSDPSSLLFYIITDLYKLGSGKEMKKWAYEITSTFLVPGAPLSIDNIDESVLNEIDQVLQSNQEHEEELKMVFVKARRKAKEQLTKALVEFRNTRTIGLSNIFTPNDAALEESIRDKNAELRIIESSLVTELESLVKEDIDSMSDKNTALASALATVLKNFGVKTPLSVNLIEKFPTFVAKEKSRLKFFARNKRFAFQTINTKGHHFQSQQYHCVTYCNHCQHIIWGVGDQGYQCSNCEMNIHKTCVKVVEEQCIGSLRNKKTKKNHRMPSLGSGIMENIIPKNRKPQSSTGTQSSLPSCGDRLKRPAEEWSWDSGLSSTSSDAIDNEKHSSRAERAHGEGLHHQSSVGHGEADKGFHSTKCTSIGRSESFRQRRETRPSYRKRSDPNIPRSKSDVDVDDRPNNLNDSGSSSNSSLSTRSLESPSNSCEMVHRASSTAHADTGGQPLSGAPHSLSFHSGNTTMGQLDDSDLECDTEPPNWQTNVDRETLKLMKPKERKRQDVINELFHTERTHVRNLKILDRFFFRPLQQDQLLGPDLLNLLFPNLDELLEIHCSFNAHMKSRRKQEPVIGEIGDMMLQMMDGDSGEHLKWAVATFCKSQSVALEALKNKQKKDQKLSQFLADAEMHPVCRRLQLKDIIATGFQRLTKYPMLLENVAKYSAPNSLEHARLLEAVNCSRNILAQVNQAVRDAENQHRLADLQRRLDKSAFDKVENSITQAFKHLDLRSHRLVHEGQVTWRLSRQKSLEVLMVLLEDLLVLLQKQDERLVLRFHSTALSSVSKEEGTKITYSPVLRLQHVLTRDVATDKKAFFVLATGDQHAIYEFAAGSPAEKKMWLHNINEAMKSHAIAGQLAKQSDLERAESSETAVEDPVESRQTSAADVGHSSCPTEVEALAGCILPSSKASDTEEGGEEERAEAFPVSEAVPPALLNFSEVVVCNSTSFERAQPVLTPPERLRRKEQEILDALKEKQDILAEVLQIPKGDYEHVVEMSEMDGRKGITELLLLANEQADKLLKVINEAMNTKEEDATNAASSIEVVHEDGIASPLPAASHKAPGLPSIPTDKLLNIASPLKKYLILLLPCVEEIEQALQQPHKLAPKQPCEQPQLHHVIQQQKLQNGSVSQSSEQCGKSRQQTWPCNFVSLASSSTSDVEERWPSASVEDLEAAETTATVIPCSEAVASANSIITISEALSSATADAITAATATSSTAALEEIHIAQHTDVHPPPLPLSVVFREACIQTSQEQLCCCPITDLDDDLIPEGSKSESGCSLREEGQEHPENDKISVSKQQPKPEEDNSDKKEKAEDATTPTPETSPCAVYF